MFGRFGNPSHACVTATGTLDAPALRDAVISLVGLVAFCLLRLATQSKKSLAANASRPHKTKKILRQPSTATAAIRRRANKGNEKQNGKGKKKRAKSHKTNTAPKDKNTEKVHQKAIGKAVVCVCERVPSRKKQATKQPTKQPTNRLPPPTAPEQHTRHNRQEENTKQTKAVSQAHILPVTAKLTGLGKKTVLFRSALFRPLPSHPVHLLPSAPHITPSFLRLVTKTTLQIDSP